MNKVKFLILISAALSLLLSACTDYAQKIEDEYGPKEDKDDSGKDFSYEIFKDERDGRTYKAVYIGDKLWMAENLNYDTGICYGFEDRLCDKYGRLYSWNEARKACPEGWHLPTKEELESLVSSVGGLTIAGLVLRSSTDWDSDFIGNDDYHFSALPAGMLGFDGTFAGVGYTAAFWSSTQSSDTLSYYLIMRSENPDVRINEGSQNYGYSVRCVEGNIGDGLIVSHSEMTDSRDGQTYKTVSFNGQEWMAQNLNYVEPYGSSYCYHYSADSCAKYGRLYTTPYSSQVCPNGWHLPTTTEWKNLFNLIRTVETAGEKLKSTNGWTNLAGSDEYGFSILPAGRKYQTLIYPESFISPWSNGVAAKLDVQIKPSAYHDSYRCDTESGWENCGSIILKITNHDTTLFEKMELRLYLIDASLEEPDVFVYNEEDGVRGLMELSSIGPSTQDYTGAYYYPVYLEGYFQPESITYLQLTWPTTRLSSFENGWSINGHESQGNPVEFDGVDLTLAPYSTESEKAPFGYVQDPYIPIYVDGLHIYGYSPEYDSQMFVAAGQLAAFWGCSGLECNLIYFENEDQVANIVGADNGAGYSVRCVRDY